MLAQSLCAGLLQAGTWRTLIVGSSSRQNGIDVVYIDDSLTRDSYSPDGIYYIQSISPLFSVRGVCSCLCDIEIGIVTTAHLYFATQHGPLKLLGTLQ